MKVLVIEAAGHKITNIRVIESDAVDSVKMDKAVVGQDAVVDTIGGKNQYKVTILEISVARTIITSMKKHGVRRLVVTSMFGEGDSMVNFTI